MQANSFIRCLLSSYYVPMYQVLCYALRRCSSWCKGEKWFPWLNPPSSLYLQYSLLPIPLHHQTLPREASLGTRNRNSPSCKPHSGHLWWLTFLWQSHFPLSGPVSKRWKVPPVKVDMGTKWWLPQDAHILNLKTWDYSALHVNGRLCRHV